MNRDDITKINPTNEALKFVAKRIELDDYRGLQISEHNRFSNTDVKQMLDEMYKLVGDGVMQIRTTDLSKRPYADEGEEIYCNYAENVKKRIGKGTQDSIRKNYFVDFHRMNFIERFDKDMCFIQPYESRPIKFVKLSNLGKALIHAENIFQEAVIYSEGLKNLFGDFLQDARLLLSKLELHRLSMMEYTYFASFLGKSLGGHLYTIDDIVSLIESYRRLSKHQQIYLDQIIKEICEPSRFEGNKKAKRDFNNWKNESQQVFDLLNQTVFFEVDKENVLTPRLTGELSVYEDITKYRRSVNVKQEYFDKHKVQRTIGYELHHIVALSFARNKVEYKLYDTWENLIYIDGKTHSQLSQTGNKNNILSTNREDLLLKAIGENAIYLKYQDNVYYNYNLQQVLINYNKTLLNLK